MVISESVEDYLESILVLQEKNGYVRSVDIANHLEISKASVSIAMKNLKENKFVKFADNHEIKLTPTGLEIAKSVYEKHLMFSEFFYNSVYLKILQHEMHAKLNMQYPKLHLMQ